MRATYSIPPSWLDKAIKVWVIGAGGTGSELLDILARMHLSLKAVGHPEGLSVVAFDGDTVSESNLVRQRFWPCDIGKNKAHVAIQRFNLFLGLTWEAVPRPFSASILKKSVPDILITCVDTAKVRKAIANQTRYLRHGECLWLDTGNGQRTGQVCLGHLRYTGRGIRLPHVADLYDLGQVDDAAMPSCSAAESLAQQTYGVNKTIATAAGNLLWGLFTRPSIEAHGAVIDCQRNMVQPLRIDTEQWEFMGWNGTMTRGGKATA